MFIFIFKFQEYWMTGFGNPMTKGQYHKIFISGTFNQQLLPYGSLRFIIWIFLGIVLNSPRYSKLKFDLGGGGLYVFNTAVIENIISQVSFQRWLT